MTISVIKTAINMGPALKIIVVYGSSCILYHKDLSTLTQSESRVPVSKRYFTVFSTAEKKKRTCKQGTRATFLVHVPFLSEPCQKFSVV